MEEQKPKSVQLVMPKSDDSTYLSRPIPPSAMRPILANTNAPVEVLKAEPIKPAAERPVYPNQPVQNQAVSDQGQSQSTNTMDEDTPNG